MRPKTKHSLPVNPSILTKFPGDNGIPHLENAYGFVSTGVLRATKGSGDSGPGHVGVSMVDRQREPGEPTSGARATPGGRGASRASDRRDEDKAREDKARQEQVDLDLMQRIAANQEGAVAELYDRFGSLVYRMAFQAMPTRAEAEDAVQEIFVRLWRTAGRYDPTRAALVTWVMLISRRHLVDKLRRRRARIKASSLDEFEPSAASGVASGTAPGLQGARMERRESYEQLMKKIDALPELQRTVVTRAYLGGQTLRQIGEELNTPLGTIKSALSRALVRLRERTSEEMTA